MKSLVGWFCVGFAVAFIGGGIVGLLNRVPQDEAIDLVAQRHIALTFEGGRSALTYVCKSHDYFDYYLFDGSLQPDRNLLDHPLISKPFSLEGFETVFVAATGWELRDVFVTATGISITTRERIALLVGSVTGFYAGRWLFSTRLPKCNSDDVLIRLQKPEYWEKLNSPWCKS